MNAIRVASPGGSDVLKLQDVPDPQPGPSEVLVKIQAAGVNPVDTYIRAGKYGQKDFPYTPGADGAGVVVSVGPDVKEYKPGDRVYVAGTSTGSYAQLAVSRALHVHPLPAHVSFAAGAAIGVPYATAYRGLFQRGHAQPGETVFIHGASGGVGLAALQLGKAAGLTLIGTASTPEGRALVLAQGAAHVLNHRDDAYLQQLMDLTSGQGVNLILEMLANVNLGKDLTVLARDGRVVIVGSRGKVEIDPRDTMMRNADIRGFSLMTLTDAEHTEIHDELGRGLQNRSLQPVIAQEIPLANAARAHEAVLEAGARGKIVLIS